MQGINVVSRAFEGARVPHKIVQAKQLTNSAREIANLDFTIRNIAIITNIDYVSYLMLHVVSLVRIGCMDRMKRK